MLMVKKLWGESYELYLASEGGHAKKSLRTTDLENEIQFYRCKSTDGRNFAIFVD